METQNEITTTETAPRGVKCSDLLAVLHGTKQPTPEDKVDLLKLSVKIGVAGLYEHYKKDVIAAFTLEELNDVVDSTEPFRQFTVEHIYHVALYG